MGPYLAGESGALDRVAAELRHALTDIGFYSIVNHGVIRSDRLGIRRMSGRSIAANASCANNRPPRDLFFAVSATVYRIGV